MNRQHVVGRFPGKITGQDQPFVHISGQVFGAVNGEVGPARKQGFFQFFDEQALAALIGQRPVLLAISGRNNRKE